MSCKSLQLTANIYQFLKICSICNSYVFTETLTYSFCAMPVPKTHHCVATLVLWTTWPDSAGRCCELLECEISIRFHCKSLHFASALQDTDKYDVHPLKHVLLGPIHILDQPGGNLLFENLNPNQVSVNFYIQIKQNLSKGLKKIYTDFLHCFMSIE